MKPHLLIVTRTGSEAGRALSILPQDSLHLTLVSSSTEALEVAASTAYDGIILDVNMPDMDIRQLIEAIRHSDHNPTTPIVAIVRPDQQIVPGLPVQAFVEETATSQLLIDTLQRAGMCTGLKTSPVTSARTVETV